MKRTRTVWNWEQMPALLTVGEAAALLRVTEQSVRAMLRARRLPAIKAGRSWRIDRDGIRRLMEGGEAA